VGRGVCPGGTPGPSRRRRGREGGTGKGASTGPPDSARETQRWRHKTNTGAHLLGARARGGAGVFFPRSRAGGASGPFVGGGWWQPGAGGPVSAKGPAGGPQVCCRGEFFSNRRQGRMMADGEHTTGFGETKSVGLPGHVGARGRKVRGPLGRAGGSQGRAGDGRGTGARWGRGGRGQEGGGGPRKRGGGGGTGFVCDRLGRGTRPRHGAPGGGCFSQFGPRQRNGAAVPPPVPGPSEGGRCQAGGRGRVK